MAVTGALPISPSTLSDATQNSAYTQTITTSGGVIPYTYTISQGSLPTGLSLNSTTGVISGIPTSAATTTFTVLVTDSKSNTGSKEYSIVVAASAQQFAFIAQAFRQSTIDVCTIDADTGLLSGCTNTGSGFNNPVMITTNPAGTFAYIANYTGNSVSYCAIDSTTRELSNCDTTGSGFSRPIGMAINPAGTYAYIGSSNGNYVSVCTIDSSSGALSDCTQTGSGFGRPFGVVLNPAGTLLYAADISGNVALCSVNSSTGLLTGCSNTVTGLGSLRGMSINSDNTFTYMMRSSSTPGFSSEALLCEIASPTGALQNCSVTELFTTSIDASNLAINATTGLAYIPFYSGPLARMCTVSGTTGALSDCVDSGATGIAGPVAIAIL